MRIATFVIGLFVSLVILLQSCTIYGLGSIGESFGSTEAGEISGSGAVGILAALAAFVATAFVLRMPTVSLLLYVIAALFGFAASASGFSDMRIWGIGMLILAGMSYWGRRELRKEQADK